jgi:diguanylate cyclase (GGDEF)-like protein
MKAGRIVVHNSWVAQIHAVGRMSWRTGLSERPSVFVLALLAVAYFLAARFGLSLAFSVEQVTTVWPPTGIALVVLLKFGLGAWPGILLGAFAINAISNEPIGTAIGIACGNTIEAVTAAWLLTRIAHFDHGLGRVRDVLALLVMSALFSTALSATIGTASLALGGVITWDAYRPVWWTWWIGDALGALIVAPALLTWTTDTRRTPLRGLAILEFVVCVAALAVTAALVLAPASASPAPSYPLPYLIFPFLIWAALRFGQREVSTLIVVVSSVAIWGALNDRGPFATGPLTDRLIMLQGFMAVTAVTALILAAITTENQGAQVALQQANDTLTHRALHDPLTGLPNRLVLVDRLRQALARLVRDPGMIALMFVDLDYFKQINDSLGHETGDRVLTVVADRIRSALRPDDTTARFGGDEFLILCENIDGVQHARDIAERLSKAVSRPIALDSGLANVSVTVGIALSGDASSRPEELIRDADAALYVAKERGRKRYEVFAPWMRTSHAGQRPLRGVAFLSR